MWLNFDHLVYGCGLVQFLKLKESSLAKAMLGVRMVWAHFCKNSNVTTKVVVGYGCHMEHFKDKIVHLYKGIVWFKGGFGPFFENYKNTSQGKCW